MTFNKVNTYDWFKENIINLDTVEGYDHTNRLAAMTKLMETGSMITGLIYQNKQKKSYENLVHGFSQEPLAHQSLALSQADFDNLVAEFR
ncbi:2-oxoacid ferredoxin oxidoreductase subunit beta [compost metagenome]